MLIVAVIMLALKVMNEQETTILLVSYASGLFGTMVCVSHTVCNTLFIYNSY